MNFVANGYKEDGYRFPPETLLRHYRADSTDNGKQEFEADLQKNTDVLDRYWIQWPFIGQELEEIASFLRN